MPLLPSRGSRAPLLALAVALLALLLSACGSGGSTDVAESETVRVAMAEFRLSPQDVHLYGDGERRFEVRNAGTVVHRFELRSADGERRIAIGRPLKPGESERLSVRLGPGDYVMRCAQERHDTLGEHGTITVG